MKVYICVIYNFVVRCDVKEKLPRESNKVIIAYKLTIYKNGHSQDNELTASNEVDNLKSPNEENGAGQADNLESPNKKSIAGQLKGKFEKIADKFASGVKTVGKTISNVFSKTDHCHLEIERAHSYKILVSKKGIDKKGNPKQSISTTRLIRHVDVNKCDLVSISMTPQNCHLTKAYLFVRYV